jgi:hypothetical protein
MTSAILLKTLKSSNARLTGRLQTELLQQNILYLSAVPLLHHLLACKMLLSSVGARLLLPAAATAHHTWLL